MGRRDAHPAADLQPVLVVTGVSLRAEAEDRPVAYNLRDRLRAWEGWRDNGRTSPPEVIVCSDVWWLNDPSCRRRPTIALGAPEVNALTAFLAARLPSAFAVQDRLAVLIDLDLPEPHACCWGEAANAGSTAAAADAFAERYLDHFMLAAVERFGA